MHKITAWLITILGLWLVLAELNILPASLIAMQGWIIAIIVLAIGIIKLVMSYSKKKR